MSRASLSALAVSLGDPAGIGPEVIAKCWDNRAEFGLPPFVAIGDGRSLAAVWDGPIEVVDDPARPTPLSISALPLIQISGAEPTDPGHRALPGPMGSSMRWNLRSGLPARDRRRSP